MPTDYRQAQKTPTGASPATANSEPGRLRRTIPRMTASESLPADRLGNALRSYLETTPAAEAEIDLLGMPIRPRWEPATASSILSPETFRTIPPGQHEPPREPGHDGKVPQGTKALASYTEFWAEKRHWKDSMAAKLRESGNIDLADDLDKCRSEMSIRRCTGCGKTTTFWNRCDSNHCPCCQPRLAREKRESVDAWCKYIGQPKHVVLTCRNTATLSQHRVKQIKKAFGRLRRTRFCTKKTEIDWACDVATKKVIRRYSYPWIGGFYSLEVTKEDKGWHLHIHALVDARFIDSVLLAQEWAKQVGQDIAIVKVKDARDGEYLQELLKYVVKGADLAKWHGHDIATLIHAFAGINTFAVFGSLFGKRAEFRAILETLKLDPEKCECGCRKWEILTPAEMEWRELTAGGLPPPSPSPAKVVPPPQTLLPF